MNKNPAREERNDDIWNASRFAQWLRSGIEAYTLEDAGAEALPEATAYILRAGSLPAGLRLFTERLNAKRKAALKQGIANALAGLEPDDRLIPVAEHLLAVAVACSADAVLDVVPGKIGNGFFGDPNDTDQQGLFASAIQASVRLASPGHSQALLCLRSLIGSHNFKPAYAGAALIGLCQIDPLRLAQHLQTPKLRSFLQQQFKQFEDDKTLPGRLAETIFGIIGLEGLKQALPNLHTLDPNVPVGRSADDWLVEGILHSQRFPSVLDEAKSYLDGVDKDIEPAYPDRHTSLPKSRPSLPDPENIAEASVSDLKRSWVEDAEIKLHPGKIKWPLVA